MLYINAKVVMRRPSLKAYGHLVDVLSFNGQHRFKMADIYICFAVRIFWIQCIWIHDTLRMRGCVDVSVLHHMRLVRALPCG